MARQIINVGVTANDGTGDGLRTAFTKSNENFSELYANTVTPTFLSNGTSNIGVASSDGNVTVSIANLSNVAIFTQTSLDLTANLSANIVTATSLSATSRVDSNIVYATGNITGANVITTGYFVGDGGLLSNVTAFSNVTVTQIANNTSILSIDGVDGNIEGQVNGVQTLLVTDSSVDVTGNITSSNNVTAPEFVGDLRGSVFSDDSVLIVDAVAGVVTADLYASVVDATGNVSGGNLTTTGIVDATGNITGGNLTTAGVVEGATVDATGNISGGNLTTAGLVSATGNVSGGNLTTSGVVDATGNVSGGNIVTVGVVEATGNVSGNYFIGNGSQLTGLGATYSDSDVITLLGSFGSNTISTTGNITAGNFIGTVTSAGTVTTAAQPNITSVGTLSSLTLSGNIAMGTNNITGLAGPVAGTDAATKTYVDTVASAGLHYHDPVRVEQEGNLTVTYNNGTDGVGATLTNAGTQAALVVDGITMVVNDRVLIYEQTDQTQNGVYTVTNVGSASTNWVLTRATDADSYGASDPDALGEGDAFFVQEGAAGAGELYVMNTSGTITFGTTNITFSQINSAQIYSATNGIDLTGVTFSLDSTYSPTFAGLTIDNVSIDGNVITTSDGNGLSLGGNSNGGPTNLYYNAVSRLSTKSGGVDITGELDITGDLKIDQAFYIESTSAPSIVMAEGDTTNLNTYIRNESGDFEILTINDAYNSTTSRFIIDHSTGNITANGNVLPGGSNATRSLGSATSSWASVYATTFQGVSTSAQYADVAELYASDAQYAPGTVVVFGGSAEVTQSARDADATVAGVVSTQPAYLMNDQMENSVAVALLGRVPTQVQGTIKRGQMLVSTDNGRARAEENPQMGTVIGKALEDFDGNEGVIEVVVGRL